jgi:hypothetical protein
MDCTAMQVALTTMVLAPLAALVVGAIGLGGGIYETLLVDRVWPDNPALIQPSRGGINRGLFWGPVQTLNELALIVALYAVWSNADARWWIIVALVFHVAARVWSFAYFIPRALRFEKSGDLSEEQGRAARRWTHLSRWRPMLAAASIASQCLVVLHTSAGVIPH